MESLFFNMYFFAVYRVMNLDLNHLSWDMSRQFAVKLQLMQTQHIFSLSRVEDWHGLKLIRYIYCVCVYISIYVY